jgi:hypothetical protein
MSASALTHNNRTLRFIKAPHCCNGTVVTVRARNPSEPAMVRSQAAFRTTESRRNRATGARDVPGDARAQERYNDGIMNRGRVL